MTALLQLALDDADLDLAMETAQQCGGRVDVIEAGTLLCLAHGMRAVRSLRDAFPDKTLVGDVRIARAGRGIAEMAFDAGADWITVVGEAPPETVESAIRAAESRGGHVQIEPGFGWSPEQARQWRHLGIEHVICHASSEAGGSGWPDGSLNAVRRFADAGFKVTAAGGISRESVPLFAGIPVFAFVAGRSITQADDPADAAQQIKAAIAHG